MLKNLGRVIICLLVLETSMVGCSNHRIQSRERKKAAKVVKSKPLKKELRKMLGKTVELRGKAVDLKAGAILMTDDGEAVYIEGLDYWPDNVAGKNVSVIGLLRRKKLIPDPQTDADGTISQGAQGEQLVLEQAKWKTSQ